MSEKDTAVRKSDEQVEEDKSSLSCPQNPTDHENGVKVRQAEEEAFIKNGTCPECTPGLFKKFAQLYAQYITGKGELIVMFTGYVFLFLIPAYYTITTKIPPDKDIVKTHGILFYKTIPGKGYLIGLHTNSGDVMFTCKSPITNNNGCSIKIEDKSRIEGLDATVYWYYQKKYIMSYQKRLIELNVGNNTIISRDHTEKIFNNARKITVIFSIIGFAFIRPLKIDSI